MSFQNVGTVNAGVVKFTGAAPAIGGVPTMDAAGIASGGAFLVSELEKRDPMIRKPLTSVTYPRDIVIQTGGGWVDYVSAMSVAYGITGGAGAAPVQAGGANGLPIVQASVDIRTVPRRGPACCEPTSGSGALIWMRCTISLSFRSGWSCPRTSTPWRAWTIPRR